MQNEYRNLFFFYKLDAVLVPVSLETGKKVKYRNKKEKR